MTAARLTIDLDALAANHALLRRLAGGAEVAPVVKADGYGLGAAAAARRLAAEGARSFHVARLSEGVSLRAALGPEAAIYVLDGATPGSVPALLAERLVPVLNSLEQVALWNQAGPAGLHVDTGMNRLGVRLEEAHGLAGRPCELVISHLACADEPDHALNAIQLERFQAVRALFPGVKASLANSAGVFLGPDYVFDLVRPGIALYGGGGQPGLSAVATFEVPVLQVRDVPAGETIGYGATFMAGKPLRVAILAAGYADGVLRASSPAGAVWLAGGRRRLLGRVSMDLIAVDVTDAPGVAAGDLAELFGPNLPVEDAAAAAGTLGYELLCRMAPRADRRWTPAQP
ncbi:alanine racemase [Caulobacter ginsengisoli]|uniref:Alanine racemase n=1 Tax=Caulobacter ginsengisoli TaxID=400775 RepID=A0ABU0IPU7_9CAUL|nr:alanine racemase [Caulobacter ginsengisoli]MDQ0464036.1 alanine racemase [Caulobacter ginsengisoli]